MSLEAFHREAREAARAIAAQPTGFRWLLHCDTDADGLSAAAVTALMLGRIGQRYHIHASRDKTAGVYERLLDDDASGVIVLDKGTSHVGTLGEAARRTGKPVIVIDHHNLVEEVPDEVTVVNPRLVGLDGSNDASSSTAAVAVAKAMLGKPALAWAGIGLVGAIGDWQHMGGWDGWNQELIQQATAAGHLEELLEPAFIGIDLAEALSRDRSGWGAPIPGITGDPDAARSLLQDLDVPDEGDAEGLDPEAKTRLVSALSLAMLAGGSKPEDVPSLVHPNLATRSLGPLRRAFRIVDACGREGETGIGVAWLMGDPSVRDDALQLFGRYQAAIQEGLEQVGSNMRRHDAFVHVGIDRPEYTGMVGGLGMTVLLDDKSRPMCVTAPRPDGDLQVSTRGTNEQVDAGLDLGDACRRAAEVVGREGGGHPIAAGTVIDPADLEPFLAALDDALKAQRFVAAS